MVKRSERRERPESRRKSTGANTFGTLGVSDDRGRTRAGRRRLGLR
jgi:hypothetical protein